jgi:hypothetical protein
MDLRVCGRTLAGRIRPHPRFADASGKTQRIARDLRWSLA